MSVDSGLPDFRSPEGFWTADPPYEQKGLSFRDLSRPRWFREDSELAWGFYGHRLNLYRTHQPHQGYTILNGWCQGRDFFVFSSNVDGYFHRAGFDGHRIVECHGSINFLQRRGECPDRVFSAERYGVQVDDVTIHAQLPHPVCDRCGAGTRPNILMFYDNSWVSTRTDRQEARYKSWVDSVQGRKAVVVEVGGGTAITTVRDECECVARELDAVHIRINPRDSAIGRGVSIPLTALEALTRIDAAIQGK